jgi:hypothetical protein
MNAATGIAPRSSPDRGSHCNRASVLFPVTDYKHIRYLLQLRLSDLGLHAIFAQIDLDPQLSRCQLASTSTAYALCRSSEMGMTIA